MKKLTVHSRQFTVRTLLLLFTVNCLLFASCVPSETPAVLNQTPGAAVLVDGKRYHSAIFSARIPAGWRAITSPAGSAPAVTLSAPDNCTVIHLSTEPAEPPTAPDCDQATQTRTEQIALASVTIYAAASAPISTWDDFSAQFDQVAASLADS